MISKLGLLVIGFIWAAQEIPICRPLKENEAYTLKSLTSIKVGSMKVVKEGKWEHKCTEVDDRGLQHIEATSVEGTRKVGNGEAESTKGEAYNYFQNSFGQRFEYEEIRATLKEDPVNFLINEIHSKLKDHTVVASETWTDKSAHTQYKVTAEVVKKYMGTECIEVTRQGIFANGITGEFKEDSWYRVSDGQLMYQQTTADNVVAPGLDVIEYLETKHLAIE